MTLTRARTIQYIGVLLSLGLIAVGYWYFGASAGVKKNTSASQSQGTGRLDSGLRGYWKLDDASGTTAADGSTNGNNGTLTNGPTWTTGQIGGALSFDGTNDYVDLGTGTINDVDAPFTQSIWVYPTAVGDTSILFEGQDGNGTETYINAVNSFGNLVLKVGINGSGTGIQTGYTPINTWYHIVMTYDSTTLSFYLNGALYGTANYAGSITERANNMRIGADKDGTSNFSGKVDEVRVYDRLLSADEVGQLYRLTAPTSVDTSLKGYWSFNAQDMSGTTAYDRSGAGNSGTLTNGPAKAVGRVGQAVTLDGTNDYVVIPNSSSLQMSSSVSFSFWMRPGTLGGESYDTLVSKWDNYYTDIQTGTGIIEFGVDANAGALSSKTAVIAGNWYFVSAVFDDTGNTMSLYINGVLDNSQAATGTMTPTTDNLMIGSWDTTTEFFTGQIDEVRVYSRALSATEIKAQYDAAAPDKGNTSASQTAGIGRLDSGLVGYWKLDDGTSGATPTTAADGSAGGNNGTLTNGPTWTTGRIGSAVTFDGTNDYITMGDIASIDGATALTASAWAKSSSLAVERTIVSKSDCGGGVDGGPFSLGAGDTVGTPEFVVYPSGGTPSSYYKVVAASTIDDGNWHLITGVYDGATVQIFIDGIASGSAAAPGGDLASTSMAVDIGRCSGAANFYWNNAIDEVRIYNRALSNDEIAQLYRLTAPTDVDTSLKGYWSFNGQDVSGTTAYDRSGAGNNGTLTNGPTGAVGRVGQALSFDGVNDEMTTTTNYGTASTLKTFTLSVWFKTSSASGKKLIGMESNQTGTGSSAYDRQMWIGTDGKIRFGVYTTTSYIATSSAALNDGLWHHAVGTSTGDNGVVTLYIDGVLQGTTNITGTLYAYTTSYWRIGGYINTGSWTNGSDGYYTGQLDEVRVYNRALSVAEIKAQYDLGAPDKGNTSASQPQGTGRLDSDLAGYWKLDENTGTSAADSSTNGNTGTLTNGPTWITGQIGSGVQFDGTNDHINAGTGSSLILTDKRTIAAWVYITGTMVNGNEYYIARKYSSGDSNSYYGLAMYHNGSSIVLESYQGGGGAYVTSTGTFTAGQWYHVAVTFDKPTVSFYINGRLDSTATDSVGGGYPSGSGTMFIGSASGAGYMNGRLDDVRVYGRPLSADEVSQLYRLSTPTGVDTSLKGYWSFNGQDVSGTTAYDRSGTGSNGALTNGTAKGVGKIGQGITTDGTNDVVTAACSGTFSNFTVSFWAKTNGVGGDSNKHPFDMRDDAGNSTLAFRSGTADDLFIRNSAGTTAQVTTLNFALDNNWHHYAATTDGTNLIAYMDGVNVGSTAWSSSLAGVDTCYMGASGVATDYFAGSIDEVRLYTRTLSAAEIQSLYNLSK